MFPAPKRRSGPGRPAILDEQGNLVWFHPTPKGVVADDFPSSATVASRCSRGGAQDDEPRLERGTWVLADRSYREIARVRAGNRLQGDLHDMQPTRGGRR